MVVKLERERALMDKKMAYRFFFLAGRELECNEKAAHNGEQEKRQSHGAVVRRLQS